MKKENVKSIKLRFAGQLILFIIATSMLALQLRYVIVLKKFGFEYIHDQYEILFYIIVLWAVIGLWMIIRKSGKQTLLYMFVSIMAIFLINIFLKANCPIQVIDSFSPDFHQRAVLKYDTFMKILVIIIILIYVLQKRQKPYMLLK